MRGFIMKHIYTYYIIALFCLHWSVSTAAMLTTARKPRSEWVLFEKKPKNIEKKDKKASEPKNFFEKLGTTVQEKLQETPPVYAPINITQDSNGTIYLLAKKNDEIKPAIFSLKNGEWDEQSRLSKIQLPFTKAIVLTYIHAIGQELFAIFDYGNKYTVEQTNLGDRAPTWKQIYSTDDATENTDVLLRLAGDTKTNIWVTHKKGSFCLMEKKIKETGFFGRVTEKTIVEKSNNYPYDIMDAKNGHVWAINKTNKTLVHTYNAQQHEIQLQEGLNSILHLYVSADGKRLYATDPTTIYVWNAPKNVFKKRYAFDQPTIIDLLPVATQKVPLLLNNEAQLKKNILRTPTPATQSSSSTESQEEMSSAESQEEISSAESQEDSVSEEPSEGEELEWFPIRTELQPQEGTFLTSPAELINEPILEPIEKTQKTSTNSFYNTNPTIPPTMPSNPVIKSMMLRKYIAAHNSQIKRLEKRRKGQSSQKLDTLKQWQANLKKLHVSVWPDPIKIDGKDYFFSNKTPLLLPTAQELKSANYEFYIMPVDADLAGAFAALVDALAGNPLVSSIALRPTLGVESTGFWPFNTVLPRIIIRTTMRSLDLLGTWQRAPQLLKDIQKSLAEKNIQGMGIQPSFSDKTKDILINAPEDKKGEKFESSNLIYWSNTSFVSKKTEYDGLSWLKRLQLLKNPIEQKSLEDPSRQQ